MSAPLPWRTLPAVASLLVGLACSGPGGPSQDYSGTWEGALGGGGVLRFTVAEGRVASLTAAVGIAHATTGNAVAGCSVSLSAIAPADVIGSEFSIGVASSQARTAFRGRFGSTSSATGSYDAFDLAQGCPGAPLAGSPRQPQGSWSAVRR